MTKLFHNHHNHHNHHNSHHHPPAAAVVAESIHVRKSTQKHLDEDPYPEATRLVACEYARKMHVHDFLQSSLPDNTKKLPKFTNQEIVKGAMLGKGGFGTVYEVIGFHVGLDVCGDDNKENPNHFQRDMERTPPSPRVSTLVGGNVLPDEELSRGEIESRKFIAKHCFRNGGDARYAIKVLSPEVIASHNPHCNHNHSSYSPYNSSSSEYGGSSSSSDDEHGDNHNHGGDNDDEYSSCSFSSSSNTLLCQALADLNTETRILSALEHPNIIKLRAIAHGPRFQKDYFLILDRLYDTLEQRMSKWRREQQQQKEGGGFLHSKKLLLPSLVFKFRHHGNGSGGGKQQQQQHTLELFAKQLLAAYDLSSALAYLHKKRILHRDLKPENIGFDIRDDIKLFDFGLAKELPPPQHMDSNNHNHNNNDDACYYSLTGMCGSPRYMAPEVALDKPYNQSCDVYSFAILLWEMLALETAFGKKYTTIASFQRHVWSGSHKRPLIDENWPMTIRVLLHQSWSPIVQDRPSMASIEALLQQEWMTAVRQAAALERKNNRNRNHGMNRLEAELNVAAEQAWESRLDHLRRRSTNVFEWRSSWSSSARIPSAGAGLVDTTDNNDNEPSFMMDRAGSSLLLNPTVDPALVEPLPHHRE